jgi:hypothetical protein
MIIPMRSNQQQIRLNGVSPIKKTVNRFGSYFRTMIYLFNDVNIKLYKSYPNRKFHLPQPLIGRYSLRIKFLCPHANNYRLL